MDSYVAYRLVDWDWIGRYKEKMGHNLFMDYVDDIYSELLSMKVGDMFSLDSNVKEENRDLFVKIVCMFILEGHPDYSFSDNYKIVIRHEKTSLEPRRGKVATGKP
ncbi:MAG: hypothetical protein LUH63_12465 [Parabacteroides sp.]|nr:hypothetical protein [Parabacteroides sp.]